MWQHCLIGRMSLSSLTFLAVIFYNLGYDLFIMVASLTLAVSVV